ncbi:hypothetical protein CYMTET_18007 [Cymbomonas tetramitiformis]|uniref:Uncharacterized protein n=1 Tax=Cymbomonas tetramitiformis TaxID=36881 RepID=A0AAE0L6K6_9CHLO|nr:hypothetical protein CYMTET_18007 [Cymbomonas tetramitiformis]
MGAGASNDKSQAGEGPDVSAYLSSSEFSRTAGPASMPPKLLYNHKPKFAPAPILPTLDDKTASATAAASMRFDGLERVGPSLQRELTRQAPEARKIHENLYWLRPDKEPFEGDGPFQDEDWDHMFVAQQYQAEREGLEGIRRSAYVRGYDHVHMSQGKGDWSVVDTKQATDSEHFARMVEQRAQKEVFNRQTKQEDPTWYQLEEPAVPTPAVIPREGDDDPHSPVEGEDVSITIEDSTGQLALEDGATTAQKRVEDAAQLIPTPPKTLPPIKSTIAAELVVGGEVNLLVARPKKKELSPDDSSVADLRDVQSSDDEGEEDVDPLLEDEMETPCHIKAWRKKFERIRTERADIKEQGWSEAGKRPRPRHGRSG